MTADRAIKEPCRVATTANITLSGLLTIDGVTVVAGDHVLVRAQSSAVDNGVYTAASGAWARATDFDGAGEAIGGTQVLVTSGTLNAGNAYRVSGDGPITIGTSAINFEPAFDSESIAFNAGTGALGRTGQAKLRDSVSILDFLAPGVVTISAFQAALNAATAAGKTVEFPSDADYDIPAGTVSFAADRGLALTGGSIGGATYNNFLDVAAGHFELDCEGEGQIRNIQINLNGGTPRVRNLRWVGPGDIFAVTAAIDMAGPNGAEYVNAVFDGMDIRGAKYGLMRRGRHVINQAVAVTSAVNTQVVNSRFANLRSDAILFDQIIEDRNTQIVNHELDLVDSSSMQPTGLHWGLGVAVAGHLDGGTLLPASNIVVANITGSRTAQLVHFEFAERFEVHDVVGSDISDTYSYPYAQSGVERAVLAIYRCSDFTASHIRAVGGPTDNAADVLIYGASGGVSRNFRLRDIDVARDIKIVLGGADSSVDIDGLTAGGKIIFYGRAGEMSFNRLRALGGATGGVSPHALQFLLDDTSFHSLTGDTRPSGPCLLFTGNKIDGRGTDGSLSVSWQFVSGDPSKVTCHPGTVLGGLIASSAPAFTNYPVGSLIRNSTVASGGNSHWIHVGGGSWKAYGAIA